MPELPEVETIARQLRRRYQGKQIVRARARPVKIFRDIEPDRFAAFLTGNRLLAVSRYAKYLIWEMEGGFPVFHLGMSGIFIREKEQSNYPQHIHLEMAFEDGSTLFYQDMRKFGKIFLAPEYPMFDQLGLEPTTENFTLNNFRKLLNLKSMNLKSFLMDQRIVAGLGNIYVNEALFAARLHPLRRADSLKPRESRALFRSIEKILQAAIERFGTTYSAYRTVDGESGTNQNFLQVYQRAGEGCPICSQPIERVMHQGRSTFFCSNCQR